MLQVLLPAVPLRWRCRLPASESRCSRRKPAASRAAASRAVTSRAVTSRPHPDWSRPASSRTTADEFVFDISLSTRPVNWWLAGPAAAAGGRRSQLRRRPAAAAGRAVAVPAGCRTRVSPPACGSPAARAHGTSSAATALLETITGQPVRHPPEGRPVSTGSRLSASYASTAVIAGVAGCPFGLDWHCRASRGSRPGPVACQLPTWHWRGSLRRSPGTRCRLPPR